MNDRNILGQKKVVVVRGKRFRVQKLLVSASDIEILSALGGELARVEPSDLNCFLVTAVRKLWYLTFFGEYVVSASSHGSLWLPRAFPVGNPFKWAGGRYQVFSRDF